MPTKNTVVALLLAISLTFAPSSAAARHPVINALASPKGALIVGVSWAALSAISTFLWAFDWSRVGVSNSTKATIQEIGGLTCAGEALIFGVMIPFYGYHFQQHLAGYQQQIQALQQQIGENAV